jgi:hypothetical protein
MRYVWIASLFPNWAIRKPAVMNSVNKGTVMHQKQSESCLIGSSRYKNLKLKKKEKKRATALYEGIIFK